MDIALDWISTHALTAWALLLALALIVGDLAWRRAARRRQRIEGGGAVHRVLHPRTASAFALAFALVFAAIAVAVSHGHDELTRIDTALAQDLKANLSRPVLRAIAVLTQFGNPQLLACATALVTLALLWRRHWQLAFSWLLALAGTATINHVLKRIFQRERPLHEHGFIIEHSYSFPSGHASGAMVFYGMAAYLLLRLTPLRLHRPIIAAAITAISVIGISRILLQVHYLSDVIAGYLTGLAWLLLCIGAAEYLRLRQRAAKGDFLTLNTMYPELPEPKRAGLLAALISLGSKERFVKAALRHNLAAELGSPQMYEAYKNGTFPASQRRADSRALALSQWEQIWKSINKSTLITACLAIIVFVALAGRIAPSLPIDIGKVITTIGTLLACWGSILQFLPVDKTYRGNCLHEVLHSMLARSCFAFGVILGAVGTVW